jgi:hypothetical protein
VVCAQELCLGERRRRPLLLVDHRGVERRLQRHADHVERLHLRALLRREPNRGREHLLADDPELHRHEDLRERHRRLDLPLVGCLDAFHQPLPVREPD